jgi:hypothetical protein
MIDPEDRYRNLNFSGAIVAVLKSEIEEYSPRSNQWEIVLLLLLTHSGG